MSDDAKTKNPEVEKLLKDLGVNEEHLIEQVTKTFSPKDIVQFITIMSFYTPLLESGLLLNAQLLLLNKSGHIALPQDYVTALENWVTEYKGLKERLHLFNTKETMH